MDYIIGQRWVSHADSQLGLGVVVDVETRRVTLAFPAVGEERTYAVNNAPLTRLRFKAGDGIDPTPFEAYLDTVKRHKKNEFKPLDPEIQAKIDARWSGVLKRLGYA